MKIKELEYAVALAETGSFQEAAKRCQVVQSTISLQIQRLEKELGVSLFDRYKRPIQLTETGVVVLPLARQILHTADHMTVAIKLFESDAKVAEQISNQQTIEL